MFNKLIFHDSNIISNSIFRGGDLKISFTLTSVTSTKCLNEIQMSRQMGDFTPREAVLRRYIYYKIK